MTTKVNSIEIPSRFVDVSSRWYDGMGDMLYAVCSTGGLTTGTSCPVRDYDGLEDRDVKWYYGLWLSLSSDVGHARRAANTMLNGYDDCSDDEYLELFEDHSALAAFEDWVDGIVEKLEAEYPALEDWSGE